MGHSKSERNLIRGCSNRDIRELMKAVFASGARYRSTRNGILVYGPNGEKPISIHMTVSDHRAHLNLRRDLRAIGIATKEKQ